MAASLAARLGPPFRSERRESEPMAPSQSRDAASRLERELQHLERFEAGFIFLDAAFWYVGVRVCAPDPPGTGIERPDPEDIPDIEKDKRTCRVRELDWEREIVDSVVGEVRRLLGGTVDAEALRDALFRSYRLEPEAGNPFAALRALGEAVKRTGTPIMRRLFRREVEAGEDLLWPPLFPPPVPGLITYAEWMEMQRGHFCGYWDRIADARERMEMELAESGDAGGPSSRRRGPKPTYDRQEDKRIADAWASGHYEKYEELGREMKGDTEPRRAANEVRKAIDRHRHRKTRKN